MRRKLFNEPTLFQHLCDYLPFEGGTDPATVFHSFKIKKSTIFSFIQDNNYDVIIRRREL
jgi:hypothetical protein